MWSNLTTRYRLFCHGTQNSPPFIGVWFVLICLISAQAGRILVEWRVTLFELDLTWSHPFDIHPSSSFPPWCWYSPLFGSLVNKLWVKDMPSRWRSRLISLPCNLSVYIWHTIGNSSPVEWRHLHHENYRWWQSPSDATLHQTRGSPSSC